MKRKIFAGTQNLVLPIFVLDATSTTGGGLSGLTNTTPGLILEYRRAGQSTWTSVGLVPGTLGSFTSGGIIADGALAGAYEIGIPDLAIASGARFVAIRLRGAANMVPVLIEIELDAVNYQDSAGFGLSRLDTTIGSRMGAFALPTNFSLLSIDGSGRMVVGSIASNAITAASIQNSAFTNLKFAPGAIRVASDEFGNTFVIPSLAQSAQIGTLRNATAQAGAAGSITLDAGASTVTNFYNGTIVAITGGTGAGQSRLISAYNGTTRVATVSTPWTTAPDNTSTFVLLNGTTNATGGGGGGGDPWVTDIGTGYSGTQAGAVLRHVYNQANLIIAGAVSYSGPVDPTGVLRGPIIIGDDYLAANGRAFRWTIPAIPGINPATSTVRFAGSHAMGLEYGWNVTGTATDIGGGFWELSCDMSRTVSGALIDGGYNWSTELVSAGGTEITPIRSGKNATAARKFS